MDFATGTITLFQGVFECFNRIQLARCFEEDFAICQLKLDAIQIRLSRWGQVSGLNDAIQRGANGSEAGTATDPELDRGVCRLLGSIQDLLNKTQDQSAKINRANNKNRPRMMSHDSGISLGFDQSDDDAPLDPDSVDMPAVEKELRKKLFAAVKSRGCFKRSAESVGRACDKAKWAIYKKDQFETFISKLADTIAMLESLFPDEKSQAELQQLGTEECKELTEASLESLAEAADGCDPVLKVAAQNALDEVLVDMQSLRGITMRDNHGVIGDHNRGTQNAHTYSGQYSGNAGTINAQTYSGQYSGNAGSIKIMDTNFKNNSGTVYNRCSGPLSFPTS
jgi:hypothetical protein